ncbi:hypothetical protein Tco_0570147 [Tanacetum coccineum]
MALYLPLRLSLDLRRPAPTVLGQVARLLAVSAWWCTRTIMVEVTLGTSSLDPSDVCLSAKSVNHHFHHIQCHLNNLLHVFGSDATTSLIKSGLAHPTVHIFILSVSSGTSVTQQCYLLPEIVGCRLPHRCLVLLVRPTSLPYATSLVTVPTLQYLAKQRFSILSNHWVKLTTPSVPLKNKG